MSKPPNDDEEDLNPPQHPADSASEPAQFDGQTRVDMGDDLLEKTVVLNLPGALATASSAAGSAPSEDADDLPYLPTDPIPLEQITDQMQSARILMGEGILEDAKRILRRILLTDASRVEARKLLEEIHEIELKQIFGENETPRRRFRRAEPQTRVEVSAEVVMRGLDRDLKLGIFSEDGGGGEPQLSLFKDRAAMDAFGEQMDRDFGGHDPSERIDLGVAFLEMGLYDLAVRHFQAAVGQLGLRDLDESDLSVQPMLAATALLAYALILGGRAFEATIKLQPLLNDAAIDGLSKLDLIYLMGRAFEALGNREDAHFWFAQVAAIDPGYRDTDERLRKVGGA